MKKKKKEKQKNIVLIILTKVKNVICSFFRGLLTYSKTNVLFFTFVITSLINASILRIITVKNIFDISPILADLAVILLLASLGYLFKPKHQFKYFFFVSILFTAICMVNSVYYNNYISFASFSALKSATQLGGVSDAVFENVMEKKDFIYLFQIVAMFFVHRYLKKKHYYEEVSKVEIGKDRFLNTVVAGLIVLGFFISTLSTVDIGRLNKQWNPELIVKKYGTYTYQFHDLFVTLRYKISPLIGYDTAVKTFREHYSDLPEKQTNKYTDIFKGKNVITIHAESIQNFLLNTSFNGEDVTPNLKRLASEGIYFSNFYSEESVGTSSDSEFTFATSLMPASSGTVFMNYSDRDYTSIQKLMKNEGYYVFSMHGNNCSFWGRNVMHKSLGYDDFYCHKSAYEIDETIGLGLSDKSFFRQSTNIIDTIKNNHNKFYGNLIMLSNHTPFNTKGEAYSDFDVSMHYTKINEETNLEEELVAPYMEGTKLGYYFKSAHYADEAIGEFINELDEAGLLDDTVIVIYGDHDAKLKKSEFNRFYNYDPETDSIIDSDDENYKKVDYYSYELNRKVPFIIWTKNKKYKQEITTVMGMIDVLPTLGNMLGIKSDYALGHDIMSLGDKENIVVFPDGNWLTDKMYYSRSKDEGLLLDPSYTVSAEYINDNSAYADSVISLSNDIIVHNLIGKVNSGEINLNEGTE